MITKLQIPPHKVNLSKNDWNIRWARKWKIKPHDIFAGIWETRLAWKNTLTFYHTCPKTVKVEDYFLDLSLFLLCYFLKENGARVNVTWEEEEEVVVPSGKSIKPFWKVHSGKTMILQVLSSTASLRNVEQK